MQRKPASSLEPILKLREEQVDARALALQQRMSEADRARTTLEQEKAARRTHEQRTHQQARHEAERADAGDACLQDLSLLHAWQVVQQQRAEALEDRVAHAQHQVDSAVGEQARATDALADARAAARVVEQHRERLAAQARREQESKAEEEAGDEASARFVRRRG